MRRIAIICISVVLMLGPITAVNCDSNGNGDNNTDRTPPVISGIKVSDITKSTVTISWTTDEPSDSYVECGETIDSWNIKSLIVNLSTTSHRITLSDLEPNTTYYYRVKSADSSSNLSISSDYTFTTSDTSPIISGITVADITETSITISWITDVPSDGFVELEYYLYGVFNTSKQGLTDPVTSHSITRSISLLAPNTIYTYSVESTDEFGNKSVSAGHTFTTLGDTDTSPPLITSISVPYIFCSSVVIKWDTNEYAVSTVEYGTTTDYYSSSPSGNVPSETHSIRLNNLNPDTTYHYRISSSDSSGNESVSEDQTFTTASPDTLVPSESNIIGEWVCTRITGGFTGGSWTPSNSIIVFDEHGKVVKYEDGNIDYSGEYKLDMAKTIYSTYPIPVLVICRNNSILLGYLDIYAYSFEEDGNTLYMLQNVYDGFNYEYSRVSS